jgi:hypothetical protein
MMFGRIYRLVLRPLCVKVWDNLPRCSLIVLEQESKLSETLTTSRR